MKVLKAASAEAIGTFGMVLCGTGAIVINDVYPNSITHLGVSIAFGLSVTLMILAFGRTSGAHINPAVTFGFWFSGHLEKGKVLPYFIGQLIGAIAASFVLKLSFPEHTMLGATMPTCGVWLTFLLEFGLTFALMYVILLVSTGTKLWTRLAAYAIGLVVFLEAFFAGPFTGASMNPARSIAPALVSGHLEHLWIYMVATTLGALSAVLLCKASKGKACCASPSKG